MNAQPHNTDTAVALRDPEEVMTLSRLGSIHQCRLSFLRVLLRKLKTEQWRFDRPLWRIDQHGVGVATYRATGPERCYTLVAFAHALNDDQRSDRVIATAWDTTFTLFDGEPTDEDIERLSRNVPLQEAGRVSQSELVLSRANKSVRLFNYVVDCLAQGKQPNAEKLGEVGYLMRTTAVYGSGKFGAADREQWANRDEFTGSFQPEMLSVWLIRNFTIDLVEHMAACRAPAYATNLDKRIRQQLGVGNSTGLGMAPFLINHPALIHQWIWARETALSIVRSIDSLSSEVFDTLKQLVKRAQINAQNWHSEHDYQQRKVSSLVADLKKLDDYLAVDMLWMQNRPLDSLYRWAEAELGLEAQEQLVSLMIEPFGDEVDTLHRQMCIDEDGFFRIDASMTIDKLHHLIEQHYQWALSLDFSTPEALARVWYVSAEKLEPRLGERFEEPLAAYEQPLAPARDVVALYEDLAQYKKTDTLSSLLHQQPEHRQIIRRLQTTSMLVYAEIRDNTIAADMLPIELLRCKLAFFGATKFDPRSDRWLRITLFQGAPYPDEIDRLDPDEFAYPEILVAS